MGLGKSFVIVMLINRHCAIMAYSEKLSEIKAFGKCEVHYTKANKAFAFA